MSQLTLHPFAWSRLLYCAVLRFNRPIHNRKCLLTSANTNHALLIFKPRPHYVSIGRITRGASSWRIRETQSPVRTREYAGIRPDASWTRGDSPGRVRDTRGFVWTRPGYAGIRLECALDTQGFIQTLRGYAGTHPDTSWNRRDSPGCVLDTWGLVCTCTVKKICKFTRQCP